MTDTASTAPRRRNGNGNGFNKRQAPPEAIGGTWCVGVLGVDDAGAPVVASGRTQLRAQRAASCLLLPAAGDSVACLRIAPDEVWIMAVLQREEGTANVVGCPGSLRLAVDGGTLELQAHQVALNATRLDIATQQASVSSDSAEIVGRELSIIGSGIKVVGTLLSSVLDRVQHFSRHYTRTTDGIDRVAATHVELEAKQLMRLEGEQALVNGRELIKARGAQIHFG